MSREIRFSYILQNDETGVFMEQVFTMEQVEGSLGGFIQQCKRTFKGYSLIARRQYTGLKDKNGKEIYEGDILISDKLIVGVVEWTTSRARYGFKYKNIWANTPPILVKPLDWASRKCLVIGNIYETPELLNATNNR